MISRSDVPHLADAIRSASGINLSPQRFDSLLLSIERTFGDLGDIDVSVLTAPGSSELERLIDEVAVKETMFLRDREQLNELNWHRLLATAQHHGNGTIRIWSAGCATGEEPYSLAMLACEAFGTLHPPVRIVGSDLSESALKSATVGRYRERAIREVEQPLLDRYLVQANNEYRVARELQELVEFTRHNLVVDPVPMYGYAHFTAIVCRNVFIYFEPHVVDRVYKELHSAVVPGGILMIGATDALAGSSLFLTEPDVSRSPAVAPRANDRQRPKTYERSITTKSEVRTAPDARIATALEAARDGRTNDALHQAVSLLQEDPLNADAYFFRGVAELEADMPARAITSFRAALYADPTFGIAAFMLGRAHDAQGDAAGALRAYEQSLRMVETSNQQHGYLLAHIEAKDIAQACRARLMVRK